MTRKITKTTGWVLIVVLAFFFGVTSILKIIENERIITEMAAIGIDAGTTQILGYIELISVILFIIPRTGIVGTLLLIAYMGGVIATALQHHQPMGMSIVIQSIVWITAVLRFPEMGQRLFGTADKEKNHK